jgi:TetR/AcrR family transcriptional regulator, cholesterol catabolism regulator
VLSFNTKTWIDKHVKNKVLKLKQSYFFVQKTKKVDGNFGNQKSFHSFALHLTSIVVKERIQQKAHNLFMQYGVRSVTMDEIAEQLGVSKKTIYQYYSDKDELVDAVMVGEIQHNQDCCLKDKQEAKNAIHEVFLAIEMMQEMFKNMNAAILFELEKYYPKSFDKFLQHKYSFLYKVLKENIERGIAEELYRSDIDVEITIKARLETMVLAFNQQVFPKNKYSLVKVETELTTQFLFGLATLKGHKLITKYQQDSITKKTTTNEKTMV